MQEQSIAPYRIGPAWLITAASCLLDRMKPDCERIHLPAAQAGGGILRYGRGALPAPAPAGGRLARLRRPARQALPHDRVFDLRRNDPNNWAHFLNNHLPVFFQVCDRLGLAPGDCLLVLPADSPGYIRNAAELFGLKILTTDAPLEGEGILYDPTPWTGIRDDRAQWVQTAYVRDTLARIEAAPTQTDLPRRVFLSRRSTRALMNETEVAQWLGARGFETVYPEDLSPADQLRLFRCAEAIVAVHGAGLAPLLYCGSDAGPSHLLEILHAGHMTNVYRVMADQVGCAWIGVRGRLKPEYITPAYNFEAPFKTYSLDNFEVDIAALETAFDIAKMT
jgi:capsular polysaccharide biosynthesis protein